MCSAWPSLANILLVSAFGRHSVVINIHGHTSAQEEDAVAAGGRRGGRGRQSFSDVPPAPRPSRSPSAAGTPPPGLDTPVPRPDHGPFVFGVISALICVSSLPNSAGSFPYPGLCFHLHEPSVYPSSPQSAGALCTGGELNLRITWAVRVLCCKWRDSRVSYRPQCLFLDSVLACFKHTNVTFLYLIRSILM